MARILGIDYGGKRTGIAVTDSLQIAVHPYKTVLTAELFTTLKNYFKDEEVELVVFGHPKHADGNDTYLVKSIKTFAERLKEEYPEIKIDYQDEAYSSTDAKEIILISGLNKKARRDKSKVDLISAILILQRYLNHIP